VSNPDHALRSIRFDPAAALTGKDGEATTHLWYTDPSNKLCAGFWASEDFSGAVNYTDADGNVETYRAGDSFLIPSGFSGSWETIEPVRKFFVIYEKNGL